MVMIFLSLVSELFLVPMVCVPMVSIPIVPMVCRPIVPTVCIPTNISSVVEFQRWWVLKRKLFGQESTCQQGFFLNPTSNDSLSKSAQMVPSKSILDVKSGLCKILIEFFQKKNI